MNPVVQDGTFSLADFLDAFSEHEVQRVLRAYENSVTVDIHCAGVGDWITSRLSKEACCRCVCVAWKHAKRDRRESRPVERGNSTSFLFRV